MDQSLDSYDNGNDDSRVSIQSYIRRQKRCAMCGKIETAHWVRHWETYHPGQVPKEKDPLEPL